MVGNEEKVLWAGKPDKLCFILEGIFNPMLPFALIWFLIDLFLFGFASQTRVSVTLTPALIFPLIFILIHMMPVWIYLGGAILTFRRYQHTQYIVTDKGVYISGGLFEYTCNMKPFAELSKINIHRGIIDQMLNVGDVVFSCNPLDVIRQTHSNSQTALVIADIPDYQDVFRIVKKLQTDIYSDTMYPNDLRPKENHGYRTEYKGLE